MTEIIIHRDSLDDVTLSNKCLMNFANIYGKCIDDKNYVIVDDEFLNRFFKFPDLCKDSNLYQLVLISISKSLNRNIELSTDEYINSKLDDGCYCGSIVFEESYDENAQHNIYKFYELDGLKKFYVNYLKKTRFNEQEFINDCCIVFKKIHFKDGIHKELGDFSAPFINIKNDLVHIFSKLGDWQDWRREYKDSQTFTSGLRTKLGYDCSIESNETLNANKKDYTVTINGKDYLFSWHVKIKPDRDRVYFIPEEIFFNDSKKSIIIARLHLHLPLKRTR